MAEEIKISPEREEEYREKIKKFRFFDDTFFRVCMKDNYPAARLILGILLQKKDIEVTDIETQRDMKNLRGRSSIMDFTCNVDKQPCDVEMQRDSSGAAPARAEYLSGLLQSDSLKPGDGYEKIPVTYVIFVTEADYYGDGEPYYPIENYVRRKGKLCSFNGKAHIIYVNGSYKGDDDFGHLMHDFGCTDPHEMYYDELKQSAIYFKENEKGVEHMCQVMEDFRKQELDEDRLHQIKYIAEKQGISYEQAASMFDITEEERQRYVSALEGTRQTA